MSCRAQGRFKRTGYVRGVVGCALMAATGLTAAQNDPQSQPTPEAELEEVIVSGLRESLRSAIAEKREADNFSDVIKAEDIGELPDASVADSLQRITGVQIVRDRAASRETLTGQSVNIRGLASLSIVNGRTLLSGDISRDVDFRTLSSESFGDLIISKSPTADRIEGGLGGTIELNTRNPRDFPDGAAGLQFLGIDEYVAAGGQLDASVRFRLTEKLAVDWRY